MSHTSFSERYATAFVRNNTRLCVGLDSDPGNLPEAVRGADNPVLEFNRRIIAATDDRCCSYKLNLAFYEHIGEAGLQALRGSLEAIPEHIITIADAKRGDIGNTAERYAAAYLDYYRFDAITVNGYLGIDSLKPFFNYPGTCVFVLALTSNPGSADFQRLTVDGKPLYMEMIDRCLQAYGSTGSLGFVVGATHPDELEEVRERVGPEIPLLIPGLGTQGGDAAAAVRANSGGIAFFNVSRAVIHAGNGPDFDEQAGEAAARFVSQLDEKLTSVGQSV